jgi:hypothetical protein
VGILGVIVTPGLLLLLVDWLGGMMVVTGMVMVAATALAAATVGQGGAGQRAKTSWRYATPVGESWLCKCGAAMARRYVLCYTIIVLLSFLVVMISLSLSIDLLLHVCTL